MYVIYGGDDCDCDDYISGDWAKQTIVRKVRPQSERGGDGVAKPGVSIQMMLPNPSEPYIWP